MEAQKRKALLESPGLEIRSQGLNFLSLGLKTQIGELEAQAAFRQTQKKDPSCTLAKLESAVHSSLYRSVRKRYAPLAMVNRGLHSHLKFAKLIF